MSDIRHAFGQSRAMSYNWSPLYFLPAGCVASLRPWHHWQWRVKWMKKVRIRWASGQRSCIIQSIQLIVNGRKHFIAHVLQLPARRVLSIRLKIRSYLSHLITVHTWRWIYCWCPAKVLAQQAFLIRLRVCHSRWSRQSNLCRFRWVCCKWILIYNWLWGIVLV